MTEQDKVREVIRLKEQAPFAFDTQHAVLVVVDMQRYFVRCDYPLAQVFEKLVPGVTSGYFERVRQLVVPNVQRLPACFRERKLPIFFTATGCWMLDGRDLPGWLKDLDKLGLAVLGERVFPVVNDPSWEIDEAVAPMTGEVLNKVSSGPFSSTRLDQILRNAGVQTLFVVGLTTDVCVGLTAREAADCDFQAVIVGDACTGWSEEMHRVGLEAFSFAFGRVVRTDDAIRLLGSRVYAGAVATPTV
ncbi:MAG: hypothetical protein DMG40_22255 [Acidobacteria bacterium]|nr:MAG: hypothetical protein DMG40_22255 [Acidobacteriota bacterium]